MQRYNTGVAGEELDKLTENKENQNVIPMQEDNIEGDIESGSRIWVLQILIMRS